MLSHPRQRVRRLARERDGTRALLGVEQLRGFLGGLAQDVEMAQAAALARKAVLLPGLRVDLLDGICECRSSASRPCSSAAPASASASARRAATSARHAAPISARSPDEVVAARGVQQVELHGRPHEPARLVLGDHLDQLTGRSARGRRGCSCGRRATRASVPRGPRDAPRVTPSAPSGRARSAPRAARRRRTWPRRRPRRRPARRARRRRAHPAAGRRPRPGSSCRHPSRPSAR